MNNLESIYTMSVEECAMKLGVTLKYTYDLLHMRRLDAKKVGRVWRISPKSVDAMRRMRK